MKMVKKTLILVMFLLLFAPIQAQGLDVETYNSYDDQFIIGAFEDTINLCACQAMIDKVRIINTGVFASVYTINSNLDFADLPKTVTLRPGETRDVTIHLGASCSERPRIHDYDVLVSNNLGAEQVISRTLILNKCESINATLYTLEEEINPGEQNIYEVKLVNPAPFTEEYFVTALNYEEYFEDSQFYLELVPGQTGLVNFTFNPPSYLYGDANLEFEILSVKNKLNQVLRHELQILDNYTFNMTAEPVFSCVNRESQVPITITNTGAVENNYSLSLHRRTAELSQEEVTVAPGESTTVLLTASSDGERTLEYKVFAVSEFGEESRELEFELDFQNCYEFNANIHVADFSNVCSGPNDFLFTVENTGLFESNIIAQIEYLGEFQEFDLELEREDLVDVNFRLNIPELERIQTQSIILRVFPSEADMVFEDKKRIVVYSTQHCQELSINEDKKTIRYFEDNFTLVFTNRGVENATYNLFYEGSDKFELASQEIFLEPGQTGEVVILANLTSEDRGRHYIGLQAISQENSFLFEVTIDVKGESLPSILNNYVFASVCLTITYILVLLLIITFIFFVFALSKGWVLGRPNFIKLLALFLIPILIITVLLVYGPPSTLQNEVGEVGETTPYIKVFENTTERIDLDQYFEDPDGENLTYFVGEQLNLFYEVEDNFLVVQTQSPSTHYFSIIAFDGFDYVESPLFTLEVVERKEITMVDYYDVFCPQFNTALAVIVLLLLFFLTPLAIRKKKKSKK